MKIGDKILVTFTNVSCNAVGKIGTLIGIDENDTTLPYQVEFDDGAYAIDSHYPQYGYSQLWVNGVLATSLIEALA